MIAGSVSADLEARVSIEAQMDSGQKQSVEAVIDTGFSEMLAMPPDLLLTLGFTWIADQPMTLADGSVTVLPVHSGKIVWKGQARMIEIYAVDAGPLVGMRLLAGCDLHIRVIAGGAVTIAPVPRRQSPPSKLLRISRDAEADDVDRPFASIREAECWASRRSW